MKILIAFLCNIIWLVKCDSLYHFNCDSDPCKNGKCIDLYQKTAYQCECNAGWEGKNCNHKSLLQPKNKKEQNLNNTQDYGNCFFDFDEIKDIIYQITFIAFVEFVFEDYHFNKMKKFNLNSIKKIMNIMHATANA